MHVRWPSRAPCLPRPPPRRADLSAQAHLRPLPLCNKLLYRESRSYDTGAPPPRLLASPLQLPTFLKAFSSQRPAPHPSAAFYSSRLPSPEGSTHHPLSSAFRQHPPRSLGTDLGPFCSQRGPPLTLLPSLATALGSSSPSMSGPQMALQFLTCHSRPGSDVTLPGKSTAVWLLTTSSAETVLDRVISALLVAKSYGLCRPRPAPALGSVSPC